MRLSAIAYNAEMTERLLSELPVLETYGRLMCRDSQFDVNVQGIAALNAGTTVVNH
jgi:hypothetical protein